MTKGLTAKQARSKADISFTAFYSQIEEMIKGNAKIGFDRLFLSSYFLENHNWPKTQKLLGQRGFSFEEAVSNSIYVTW